MDVESLATAEQMDDCRLLSLSSLEKVPFWGLRIVVDEMMPAAGPENPERDFTPELAARIRAEMAMRPQRESRRFEIAWRECVSYLVQNECYGRYPEAPEMFSGKFFRRFSWSHLLELTRKTSYVSDDHPGSGPFQHVSVVCSDDVVDVIACVEPVVRRLDRD
ncbi:MAG TPA: hypothetical protein VGU25_05010 [Acidobacteriaceae bacterium]|nr:hypothetical protein [Acidobacteriaceae bacterium]